MTHLTENNRNKKLTINQEKAINFILAGTSYTDTAKACGVKRCTLWNWRNNDDNFRQALERERADMQAIARERLADLFSLSVEALADILSDRTSSSGAKLKAVSIIFNQVLDDDADDEPVPVPDDDDWDIYEGASQEAVRELLDAMNRCRRESDNARIEGNGEVSNGTSED